MMSVTGVLTAPAPAQAVETYVVDQEFPYTGPTGAMIHTGTDLFAQPFIPTQDGPLAEVSLVVFADFAYHFSAVSIHEMSEGDLVLDAPITGGSGSLSFAAHESDSEVMTATATFGDRPLLTAGKRYAIVVDPTISTLPLPFGAAFPVTLSGDSNYSIAHKRNGGWFGTGSIAQLFFSVTLAMPAPVVEVLPLAPTLNPSTQCDVPGTVDLPDQDGVDYSVTTVDDNVTVTASPLEGFEFPVDAVVSWDFSVTAEPCVVGPTVVTPQAPTLHTSTQCGVAGTVELPKHEGVAFSLTTVGDDVSVTASPMDGFAFSADAVSSWTFSVAAEPCVVDPTVVIPQVPTLHPSTQCEVPGTVQLPQQDGVLFSQSTLGAQTMVTAAAQSGFVFPTTAQAGWTFNTGAEACGTTKPTVKPDVDKTVPALAKTGSDDLVLTTVLAGLVLLAGGIVLSRRKAA